MLKKVLLFFSLLLLVGYVEGGFELTANETTNTISAIKNVDIHKDKHTNTAKDIDMMNKAVSKSQKKQAKTDASTKKSTEKKNIPVKKVEEQKRAALEAKLAKEKEEKIALERKIAKEKTEEKKVVKTAEALNFKPSTQTYQKFGTSEIHGHVVYLTPTGQEINLKNTKIYLVPQNTTTDYWYNNYYLKNQESSSLTKNTVRYINATHLNLEKNFAFYGLAKGTYYVIIESSYPSSIVKNKKVYIAKKITVEKYKKIMTVFAKKL